MFKDPDPLFQFEGELTHLDVDCPVHKLHTLYDRGDLEHRKKWATNVNQRDYVSTRTAHFAKQYGHAVAMALGPPSQSDRRTWRSLVRQYGIWMQGYDQMSSEPLTEPLRQLMRNIQYALARSFVARWRQYLPMFQEEFDELTEKFQADPDQAKHLTRYWTKLWRHIEYERIDWHGRPRSRYPWNWVRQIFSSAVSIACKTLGVHEDKVFEMIEHYGTTSSTEPFHADIEETLVKGGHHTIFAEILYRDLTELDNFLNFTDISISDTDADVIKGTLRMVIEKHIEMLYTIREPFHDKPQEWSLTAKCVEIMTKDFDPSPKSDTWPVLGQDFVVDRADAERCSAERQCRLAENATRDIRQKKRTFRDLTMEEIRAVQNSEHFKTAMYYAENPCHPEEMGTVQHSENVDKAMHYAEDSGHPRAGKRLASGTFWRLFKFEAKSSQWLEDLLEAEEEEDGCEEDEDWSRNAICSFFLRLGSADHWEKFRKIDRKEEEEMWRRIRRHRRSF